MKRAVVLGSSVVVALVMAFALAGCGGGDHPVNKKSGAGKTATPEPDKAVASKPSGDTNVLTPKDAESPVVPKGDGGNNNAQPLKIGYSDWPGWLVLEIAKQKGFYRAAGVDVDLVWFDDYGKSIEAYGAGKLDGIAIMCGDSLAAKSSIITVLTDFSEGNDMIVGKPGINSIKDLAGKTVGLEENLVEHLLLLEALKQHGVDEKDVTIKKMPTPDTIGALKSGGVDAIGAWYPISGQALSEVGGSKALFTSREAKGLIYDAIQADPLSLQNRRGDWQKVVDVWFQCLDFLNAPKTHDEAVKIMADRVKGQPADLEKNLKGTHLLDKEGNLKAMQKKNTLDSIYGSLQNSDKFNLGRKVYDKPVNVNKMVNPSLVEASGAK